MMCNGALAMMCKGLPHVEPPVFYPVHVCDLRCLLMGKGLHVSRKSERKEGLKIYLLFYYSIHTSTSHNEHIVSYYYSNNSEPSGFH